MSIYYNDLTDKLWEYNNKKKLGSSVITFYLFLLQKWKNAGYVDFSITDTKIMAELGFTWRTIKNVRRTLKDYNMIQIENIPGYPISYRIVQDYNIVLNDSPNKKKSTPIKSFIPIEEETPILFPKEKDSSNTTQYPNYEEFLEYAKTLPIYDESMNSSLKAKYDTWVADGWKTGYGKTIKSWRNTLANTLPYLKNNNRYEDFKFKDVPKITRPKSTYNE